MAAGEHRRFEIQEIDGVTVAKFIDKRIFEEAMIDIIREQLFDLIDEENVRKVIIDFSNLEYISSAAFNGLFFLGKKLKEAGGDLRLCGISREIHEVFVMTKLDKLFQIFPNQSDALKDF